LRERGRERERERERGKNYGKEMENTIITFFYEDQKKVGRNVSTLQKSDVNCRIFCKIAILLKKKKRFLTACSLN
jgi:hypothetical protein